MGLKVSREQSQVEEHNIIHVSIRIEADVHADIKELARRNGWKLGPTYARAIREFLDKDEHYLGKGRKKK